jgi:MFS transporter, ACS family, solute carrier family 17 (sodium-dependent inorganic phosphate cotransporter), other
LEEKGKFVSALLGGTLGTVVTFPLTGYIIEKFGWRYGFYGAAAFALFISLLWLYFVADSPANHPRITKKEKDIIEKSIGSTVSSDSKKSSWPPMKQMLLSPEFYSLLVLHFGSVWGLFFLVTAAPKFMSEVLKFKLTEAGILSSLPYLLRLIFGFVFGSIGDRIRHKNVLSVTTIRKSFCVFCKWNNL